MRVLYVDQNPAICSIMLDFLSRKFKADVAYSAAQGLRLMTENTFNAVIAANNRGDGLKLLAEVSEKYPSTVVRILLSGGAITEEIQQALSKGHITRFFQHPYPMITLVRCLEQDLSLIPLPVQ